MSDFMIYIWSSVNRFGVQIIGFIGNILIARQLTPDDYGLVAMLAIFMEIAMNFMQSGFADCLIQRVDADKKDFGTIHTYNVGISIVIYILFSFSAPYIADFYNRVELISIVHVLGLSIVIRSLAFTELVRLRKKLKFNKIAIIQISSKVVSIIISYMMALKGYGYWSLVFQALSLGAFEFIFILIISNYRPYFYFSLERFKYMAGFSFNLLISYYASVFGHNLVSVIIGKFHSAATLGFYSQGKLLNRSSILTLDAMISTTTFPLLAKELNENRRIQTYKSMLHKFLFLQLFIGFFFIGSAAPLIETLYGQKWINTTPYFQILIIIHLFFPLTTLNANMAKVYGFAKLYRNLSFIKNGLLIIALLITMKFSIFIILFGQVVAIYVFTIINMRVCGRLINFSTLNQFKIILYYIWIPLLSMLISYVLVMRINYPLSQLILYTGSYVVIFILINEITRQKLYFDLKSMLLHKLKKIF